MSEKREFTGVFIPAHIWISKELIPAEKMILGEVDALSKKSGWCEAGRQHFADWLQCDPTNVTYYFTKLEKKGFIESQTRPGRVTRRRVVTDRFYVDSPVNPIHPTREPHSPPPVNPIHPTREPHSPEIKSKYNSKEKGKAAHAQILSILEATTLVNDIAGPGLGDFPTAKTPAELQNELRAFYARFPDEWNFITSETPAKLQAPTQRAECVKDFCAWAIGEGWEKRDFGKINARLIRWFNDEARMKPKAATQSNTPTYSRPAGIKSA